MSPTTPVSAPQHLPRIAVLGAGRIGQRHVELIRNSPVCELAGVVDPAPHAAAVAQAAGSRIHATLDALLALERPDAVVVATPNAMHLDHALACIAAGVAVLLEKPIATSVDQGWEIALSAERAQVPLLVGHHRRHSPLLAAARELVRGGVLGKIVGVAGSALFHKPDEYFTAAPWRREAGGGPILINMVHEVDTLRWLCGELAAVQAMGSNAVRGFGVEDTVTVTMRFTSGALGTFLLSDTASSAYSWEQTSGEDPSYAQYPDHDCYVLAGTLGSLAIPTMRLMVHEGPASWQRQMRTSVLAVVKADPLERQLEHFCSVLRGETKPLVSGRDATETLRVTLAIAEAVRTQSLVPCAPG